MIELPYNITYTGNVQEHYTILLILAMCKGIIQYYLYWQCVRALYNITYTGN